MKRLINKILFGLTLTGGSLGLHSCGDWLDINSNELAATKTEAGYLFNYAAINYSSKRVGGDQWLPIIYAAQVASDADNWFVGADMYNISTYATGNGWVTSYSSCGYNLLKAIEFRHGRNDSNSVAQCKILLANTVWESSMLYGDIPYSEAWNIEGTQTPKFDTQKDVFYSVIGLLDEALDGIDESNSKRIDKYDIYYTGDMAKWRRLGNSLKLKFYMYLANKEDVGDEIKAIIDGGELMNSSADDFVFPLLHDAGQPEPQLPAHRAVSRLLRILLLRQPDGTRSDEGARRPAHPDLLPRQRRRRVHRWKRRRRVRSSPTRRSARNRRCARRRSSRRITCCAPTTPT